VVEAARVVVRAEVEAAPVEVEAARVAEVVVRAEVEAAPAEVEAARVAEVVVRAEVVVQGAAVQGAAVQGAAVQGAAVRVVRLVHRSPPFRATEVARVCGYRR
jgi:hypothetical protein